MKTFPDGGMRVVTGTNDDFGHERDRFIAKVRKLAHEGGEAAEEFVRVATASRDRYARLGDEDRAAAWQEGLEAFSEERDALANLRRLEKDASSPVHIIDDGRQVDWPIPEDGKEAPAS